MPNPHRIFAALALATAFAMPFAAWACDVPASVSAIRADMVAGINAQRASGGLAALSPSPQLTEAAQKHACDNARRNKMSHTGSDGSSMGTRIDRTGYRWRKANENVGYGYKDAAAMLAGWIGSDGHRRNIMARGTQDIGIGLATGSDGKPHWVMVSAGR